MELLAPAGSYKKMITAISYGADSVYLALQKFGLRSAATNFSFEELQMARDITKKQNKKIYVVINSFLHDEEHEEIIPSLEMLKDIGVDAIIVSDLGTLNLAKRYFQGIIHISTQSSVLNTETAKFWRDQGAKRIVLAREVSLDSALKIKESAQVEIEMFVHGAMCASYSGHCFLSNYLMGRDSNRGGCAHPCRFNYDIEGKEDFYLSSMDLCALELIPKMMKEGVDSFKVEGRMKANNYLATTIKSFRMVMNAVLNNSLSQKELDDALSQLDKISHRKYFLGGLLGDIEKSKSYNQREAEPLHAIFAGEVISVKDDLALIEVLHPFQIGDCLEVVSFSGANFEYEVLKMHSLFKEDLLLVNPGSVAWIKMPKAQVGNVVRLLPKESRL